MKKDMNIVCLGGGIGTVNLIKGLKEYWQNITVVISMADEGGSAGRLRRLYGMFPPGDLVSCMAAFSDSKDSLLQKILTYRFPGDRYGKDGEISGHKLGNLMLAALFNMTKDFDQAAEMLQKFFDIKGTFLPATENPVTISAKTIEGKIIKGEENIDLGKYDGKRILEEVYLHPKDAKAHKGVVEKMVQADLIIAGPGDLYTTILPTLIIPDIKNELTKSKALKFFIVNIANKPFETKNYSVLDYQRAIERHLGSFPFDIIVTNNNYSFQIPKKYDYKFVEEARSDNKGKIQRIAADLVNEEFPLYHDPVKLAKAIASAV